MTPDLAPSRGKSIVIWVLRVIIALFFLATSLSHISGWPAFTLEEFDQVGLGQWFRYFVGALEMAGVLLVLIPRTSAIGGLVLLTVDIGAFVAEVTVLHDGVSFHSDWIHCVVFGLILVFFIYLQRDSLTALRRRDRLAVTPLQG